MDAAVGRSPVSEGVALKTAYDAVVGHYNAQANVAALEALETLGALAPKFSFYREHYFFFKISILGFRFHDHAGVLPLCEQARAEFPVAARLAFLHGRALAELGYRSRALGALKHSLKGEPDHRATVYELAKILFLEGRLTMARRMAERAASLGMSEPLLTEIMVATPASAPASPRRAAPWRTSALGPGGAHTGECEGVFQIVGSSYCGSTLLNALLGAHSQVAGGGELHWLARADPVERRREGVCVFCGEACPVWTVELRQRLHAGNVHDEASHALGRPFVCDSSKMPDWSSFVSKRTRAARVRVLLVKHPLRHVASFVEKARRIDRLSPMADIDHVIDQLAKLYAQARLEPLDMVMRYEDLVGGPRAAVGELLGRFDLAWEPAAENWRAVPHHSIGGNAGPRSQIDPTLRPAGGFLQRKYNRGDVFVDDSFAAILSPAEIDHVLGHPAARRMLAEFGYDARIEPGEWPGEPSMSREEGEASLHASPAALVGPYESDGGFRFLARLELLPQHAYLGAMADTEQTHTRSPIALLEDGRALGPAHVVHEEIARDGAGRFSHWNEVLYFSSSDGSDPNRNGRIYSVAVVA